MWRKGIWGIFDTLEVWHFNKGLKKSSKLKTRVKPSEANPILKQIDVISYLEALQKI